MSKIDDPAPANWREVLQGVVFEYDRNTCAHDELRRGGTIWTICCECGAKWADDEGGFVPYSDPPEIMAARAMLAAAPPPPAQAADGWRPKVKPLEWTGVEVESDKFARRAWSAPTLGGHYHIEQRGDDAFDVWAPWATHATRYGGFDEAAEHANIGNEARILSALVTPPAPEAGS